MRICLFYHSLVSDWNHGNAHFLRGVATELLARGHQVEIFEPRQGWSREQLLRHQGPAAIERFARAYPGLRSRLYDVEALDLDEALDQADLVIVHEWNEPRLAHAIGRHRQRAGYRLLFHDTHHRAVSDPGALERMGINLYDGVLAFGRALADLYALRGWNDRIWVWHEAADVRLFRPLRSETCVGELVWIGNWGDDERGAELEEFVLQPVRELGLQARFYGVRYPPAVLEELRALGVEVAGWLPNYEVPCAFARFAVTVHVPRRPYARILPGIPTIRVFEALACGIPLVCAPWRDSEGLFRPGVDYLTVRNGAEMSRCLHEVLSDASLAAELARNGRQTILERHTCGHRVDELLAVYDQLNLERGGAGAHRAQLRPPVGAAVRPLQGRPLQGRPLQGRPPQEVASV